MKWSRAKEGYLQIDHRASAGNKLVPGGTQIETATATCCHCNGPFPIANRLKVRWCRRCNDYVCNSPECLECTPFDQKLDEEADAIHRLIQAGKL